MALRRRRLASPSGSAMRKARISAANSTYHLGASVQSSRVTPAVHSSTSPPARRAGAVSPLTAVWGNAGGTPPVRRGLRRTGRRLAWQLGVHHALAGRRNLVLVAGSFALSIVLGWIF